MGSASAAPDAILHLAALHTLAQSGFASTSRAASLTISSVVSRYLHLVASACVERANLAGRSKVAAIDVVQVLDDLGVEGVGELHEWAVDLDQEVMLDDGAKRFEKIRKAGGQEKGTVDMRLVHDDEIKHEDKGDGDEMDVDGDEVEEGDSPDEPPEPQIRFTSPDLSWLPALPGSTPLPEAPVTNLEGVTPLSSLPKLSTVERYRRVIPYSQSQLAQSHPFVDPVKPGPPPDLPPALSSFPSLIKAFEATASDPSIALRQTPLRQQAAELLRRSIATADAFSPAVTLTSPIPAPRTTPIIPSHSDVLPQTLIPLDPNPIGMLASLVHQVHSVNLPPALRERLTSLRPPLAQLRDGVPILYGDPVRGGDLAALARARGKQPNPEDEAYLRATWDSGPKGIEKWGRGRLPTGRKVVQSGVGEDKPREPEGTAAAKTFRLKLGVAPNEASISPGVVKVEKETAPGVPGGAGTGTGKAIKLRLGGAQMARRESQEGAGSGLPATGAGSDDQSLVLPSPGEMIASGSIQQNGDTQLDTMHPGLSSASNAFAHSAEQDSENNWEAQQEAESGRDKQRHMEVDGVY